MIASAPQTTVAKSITAAIAREKKCSPPNQRSTQRAIKIDMKNVPPRKYPGTRSGAITYGMKLAAIKINISRSAFVSVAVNPDENASRIVFQGNARHATTTMEIRVTG